ncbi:putative basic proline-rich protein-like [Iris pallida]|uniref:Basic proline-rich protein-like n=1 Tax=Iris pallida TaxID=29817 RepID=A0AAX6H3H0_IRIPA|nr:putative basic proline-rich protein-like [Iris pallida]
MEEEEDGRAVVRQAGCGGCTRTQARAAAPRRREERDLGRGDLWLGGAPRSDGKMVGDGGTSSVDVWWLTPNRWWVGWCKESRAKSRQKHIRARAARRTSSLGRGGYGVRVKEGVRHR